MKIELKNVKYAAFASEETSCFEASVWVDGKKAGTVRNDGHGGPNWIEPMSLQERVNEYAKTLPPMRLEVSGTVHEIGHNADSFMSTLLEDYLQEKELRKLLNAHLVGRRKDGAIIKTKRLTAAQLHHYVQAKTPLGKPEEGVVVLNYLPFAGALHLFKGEPA